MTNHNAGSLRINGALLLKEHERGQSLPKHGKINERNTKEEVSIIN